MREHKASRPGQPFLIHCGFPKPHAPLDPPLEYAHMYDPREVPPPVGDESLLADRNPFIERTRYTHALDSLSPEARRVIKAYYYGLISFQDAQVGRILDALEELGGLNNTLIVFTADHGDLMGDFGGFFKCNFLNGSVRVPMIFHGPGASAGGRRTQLVGLQDILPTLAALTGCPLGQGVDGLDLSPAIDDPSAPVRELFYGQCLDDPKQSAMVTDGRWKYCYCQEGPTEELYDLRDDPNELANLAGRPEHRARLKQWRETLIDQARRFGDVELLDDSSSLGLKTAPLDRAALARLPVDGMGWRWY